MDHPERPGASPGLKSGCAAARAVPWPIGYNMQPAGAGLSDQISPGCTWCVSGSVCKPQPDKNGVVPPAFGQGVSAQPREGAPKYPTRAGRGVLV
jgi:hypothetical protein